MFDILITGGVGILTTIVSSIVTFMVTRKKYNSEVDSNLIKNMQDSLLFYMNLCDDTKQRLDKVLLRNEDLEDSIRELKTLMLELSISVCTDLTCQLRKIKVSDNIGDTIYGDDTLKKV